MIRALYEQHNEGMRRVLRRRFSPEIVDEALSRTWLIACEHADQLAPMVNQAGWLRTVAKHEALAIIKHESRTVSEGERRIAMPNVTTKEDSVVTAVHLREVLTHLQALAPNQRCAIAAKAVGVSHGEVNDLRGTSSASGASTWLNRHVSEGRKALREAVGV